MLMSDSNMAGLLVLADGTIIRGAGEGAASTVVGELVFRPQAPTSVPSCYQLISTPYTPKYPGFAPGFPRFGLVFKQTSCHPLQVSGNKKP